MAKGMHLSLWFGWTIPPPYCFSLLSSVSQQHHPVENLTLGWAGTAKGCQFSVVKFLMFLTQHQTRWSHLTLWCVIFVVHIVDLYCKQNTFCDPLSFLYLWGLAWVWQASSSYGKKRTRSASHVCKSAPLSSCLPGCFEGTLSPAPFHHICLAPWEHPKACSILESKS